MKKVYYLLISFYSLLILGIIIHYIFSLFNFDWQLIFSNVERLEKFSFFVIVLTLSLTMLMILGVKVIQMVTLSTIQTNLKNVLEGRELQEIHQPEIDSSFRLVSEKLTHLTENLQKSEEQMNQLITNDKEFSQQDTDYKNLITRFNAKLGTIQKKLKEAIHTNQTLEQELADFKEKYNLSQEAVDELRTKLTEKDTIIQNTALEIDTIANQIYNVFEQHGLLNLFATGNDEER